MDLSSEEIELLESWWAGQLPEQQAEALEKRLAQEAGFRQAAAAWEAVVRHGFTPTAEELAQREAVRGQLEVFESEHLATPQNLSSRLKWVYVAAGAAAALLLLLWVLIAQPFSPLKSELAPMFSHLAREGNLGRDLPPGKVLYDRHKYRAAWPLLIEEIKTPNDSLNLLYAGVAALGDGQAASAIPLFEALLASGQWPGYEPAVKWYLALAYVENQEPQKAKLLFNELAASESAYTARAQEALARLQE